MTLSRAAVLALKPSTKALWDKMREAEIAYCNYPTRPIRHGWDNSEGVSSTIESDDAKQYVETLERLHNAARETWLAFEAAYEADQNDALDKATK